MEGYLHLNCDIITQNQVHELAWLREEDTPRLTCELLPLSLPIKSCVEKREAVVVPMWRGFLVALGGERC